MQRSPSAFAAAIVADGSRALERGKLWAHAHTAVPVITATLERSARVMDARKEESEWQENVGLCAIVLSFYCVLNASADNSKCR